jgi:hypothetical protein
VGQEEPKSIRLTIEYEGTELRLVAQRRVEMLAPAPPRRLTAGPEERGHWVELQDRSGELLYRQTLHEPIADSLEVPGADGVSLARVPRERVAGRFFVVVPDVPGAQAVSFVAPQTEVDESGAQTRELARFELEPEG